MAAKKTTASPSILFTPHLQPGEKLLHYAFGVRPPPVPVIIGLFCLAILPGMILTDYLTKEYYVGLTDRGRFLVLRVRGKKVGEVSEYRVGENEVKTSTGAIFTHIKVKHPQRPFRAKFHRLAFKTNREQAMAIAQALQTRQLSQAA